ncbi:MAG: glycosyltransferase family 4 protein [Chloroflexi bacterium]|nr:MAG: glycosyltransferase family 4 protein [Chloroflexota bacterium]
MTVLTELALRKATLIICPSHYTGHEVETTYPHTRGRVRVVGEAVSDRFRPGGPEAIASARQWLSVDEPYVLFVGTIEPRKNLARLIRAFERAVFETGAPHHLVIAGGSGWRQAAALAALQASHVRDRIHMAGYIPDELLAGAYSGADVFAYPSLSEGFGLPPLEAMACGCPVITSNTSAIPEVVGDAAVTVDPRNEGSLTEGLSLLMTSHAMRRDLSVRGTARAASFRWDQVARQVIDVYREAVA